MNHPGLPLLQRGCAALIYLAVYLQFLHARHLRTKAASWYVMGDVDLRSLVSRSYSRVKQGRQARGRLSGHPGR